MSRNVEVVLLRHGESWWNAEDRYQGQQGTENLAYWAAFLGAPADIRLL